MNFELSRPSRWAILRAILRGKNVKVSVTRERPALISITFAGVYRGYMRITYHSVAGRSVKVIRSSQLALALSEIFGYHSAWYLPHRVYVTERSISDPALEHVFSRLRRIHEILLLAPTRRR